MGSAHQKLVTVAQGKALKAFCGGIDIAHPRADYPAHPLGGWHDVQCSVEGPASLDLYQTFRERWNDPRPPSNLEGSPPAIGGHFAQAPAVGTHHVQVLRTYADNNGYPFAPMGEFTALRACIKAIGLAQSHIYIEDQFFVSEEIANALEAALIRSPRLRIIVVVPQSPSIFLAPFNSRQRIVVDRLNAVAKGRFDIYHLRNQHPDHQGEQIYVHSKLMIVDDIWAEIGSMNCNRRSLTHDVEACVAVMDDAIEGGGCEFVRDLRLSLWGEHLNLTPGDHSILDPEQGFEVWCDRSGQPGVPAEPHATMPLRSNLFWWGLNRTVWDLVDPSGISHDNLAVR